jgi:hypothetical protein
LWRGAFGVATERQLGGIEHFELWESPCGLAFFDPMLEGDELFIWTFIGAETFTGP